MAISTSTQNLKYTEDPRLVYFTFAQKMKKLWPMIKWALVAWGLFCLVGGIIIVSLAAYQFGPGNTDSTKLSSQNDVRYVLNWCRLGDERIEEVVHSYISSRSFTGDHLDAHAIRISHVEENELKKDDWGAGWHKCSEVEGVLDDALGFVEGWLHGDKISWFPTEEEIRSEGMFVYPWSIDCHGTRPTSVELIFVRPKDQMIFFISSKV